MDTAEQLRIGQHPQPAGPDAKGFLTDTRIDDWLASADRRLSQLEQGLQHFEAITPAMSREAATLRSELAALRRQLKPAA